MPGKRVFSKEKLEEFSKDCMGLALEALDKKESGNRLEALQASLMQVNPTDLARQTFNDVVLGQSSEAITRQFADQPSVEAALRESLA